MKIIDLRSDTVTKPSLEMRKAMADAEVGDDVFEDDPTVRRLEEKVAETLGHEAALFVPSGTMSNQISLRILTEPGDEVLCESGAHIFNYEVAAAAALSGIQIRPIDTAGGILTPDIIKPHIRPENIHQPRTAVMALENTHNRAGGVVYSIENMTQIGKLARENDLKYYLDGARLWNAATYLGVKPSKIASMFACVSVCFSKGLGAPVGSAVVSNKNLIKKARRVRKMFGGGMRQVGIIAAGALYALEKNYDRLNEDHRRARRLAEHLSQSPKFDINPDNIQTNIVVIKLAQGLKQDSFRADLAQKGVLVVPFGDGKIRAACHLNIDDNDIETAARIMLETAKASA